MTENFLDARLANPVCFFLDTMLLFRQNFLEGYHRYLEERYNWSIQNMVKRLRIEQQVKYSCLLVHYDEQGNIINPQ